MINKQITLGRNPEHLGQKDAIHVPIVSVRAASLIRPGSRVDLNEDRLAVSSNSGIGIADPFLKTNIQTGQNFWLIMDNDQVTNVTHMWEHAVDFTPPTKEVEQNQYLQRYANQVNIPYKRLIQIANDFIHSNLRSEYNGNLSEEALKDACRDIQYDFWYEWSDETGYEFPNMGSECCPEYDYPEMFDMFLVY